MAAVVGTGFAIIATVLGALVRIVRGQQRQTDRIEGIAKETSETTRKVNANQVAMDRRVRYLEENFWRRK